MDHIQSSRTTGAHAKRPASKWVSRQAVLPAEHGAWVFLLSPLVVGLAAGRSFNLAGLAVTAAALGAFLLRQPVTLLVKVVSKRRPRTDLPAAFLWTVVYGTVALLAAGWLVWQGYGRLFWLAVPAVPALAWHLALVSRRGERRQMAVEVLGAAALALAGPAAYWAGRGQLDAGGWALWGLCALQSGGSIVYAYLRLEQRRLAEMPGRESALRMARPALAANAFTLLASAGLALSGLVPVLAVAAFAVQFGEVVWGTLHPAVGVKPVAIGVRQLVVSTIWTVIVFAGYVV